MNRSPWKIINIYIQILSCQSLRVFVQDGQTEVLCKHQKKPISPTVCSLFTQNIHRVIVYVFHSQSGKRKHKLPSATSGPLSCHCVYLLLWRLHGMSIYQDYNQHYHDYHYCHYSFINEYNYIIF